MSIWLLIVVTMFNSTGEMDVSIKRFTNEARCIRGMEEVDNQLGEVIAPDLRRAACQKVRCDLGLPMAQE